MGERSAFVVMLIFLSTMAVAGENGDGFPVAFVSPEVTTSTDIHFDKRYCLECHTETVKSGTPSLRFTNILQTCRCHGYTPDTYTHPVDIVPSPEIKAKIPVELPLTDGKITCHTCHLIQWQCQDDPEAKRVNGIFLRVNPFLPRTAICYFCHNEQQYKMLDPHNQLDVFGNIIATKCLYCHTEKPDAQKDFFKSGGGKGQGVKLIGDLAVLCSRCHFKQRRLHPISASHFKKPSARTLRNMRKSEKQFRISLPLNYKGEVTCVTCHNPHEHGVIPSDRATAKGASEKARLRRPLFGNKICLACHRQD